MYGAPAVCLAIFGAGCADESRVVRYKPFLANVPGAVSTTEAVGPRYGGAFTDPTAAPEETLIRTNADGSTTLIAKTVAQLMAHLERTLDEEQDELLYDQLISEETKWHLAGEGHDPREIVGFLKRNRRDLAVMFARMPFGEQSPTARFERTARRQYVLRLTGAAAKDVRFTKLWVALEGGNFKLLWVS